MKKLFTLFVAACASIAAVASSVEPVKLSEYEPDPMTPTIDRPSRVSAASTDADYTEWESIGVATLGEGYNYLENTLNSFCKEGDTEIVFANTTEVMVRQLRSDANEKQFKFCKFLGYNDIIADIDATTGLGQIRHRQECLYPVNL